MIFVTLGSQKFQFDRLLQKLDELVEQGVITEKIMAQIGASNYLPKHFPYVRFMESASEDNCWHRFAPLSSL